MTTVDIYKVLLYASDGKTPIKLANDSTDKAKVSVYGKVTVAGDTPILLSAAGRQQIVAGVAASFDTGSVAVGLTDTADNNRPLAILNHVLDGSTIRTQRTPSKFIDVSTVAIGTIATVWTPTTGKKFRLMGGILSSSAAVSILFEDNSAGAGNFIFRLPKLLVDTPIAFTLGGNGFLSAAANNVLKATGSGAANIIGTLFGTEE